MGLLRTLKRLRNNRLIRTNKNATGGLVVGYEPERGMEGIYYLSEDVHSLTIGATRSGKSRCIVLQSVVIAPLVTVVAVIYYFIRKSISDEMDHKKWNTRVSTAIISCIGVVTASIIIKVIVAYYQ